MIKLHELPKQKKEPSQKQIDHLNNIRIKALAKKKIIKLQKMKDLELSIKKPDVKPEVKPDVIPDKPAFIAAECIPEVKQEKKKRIVKKKN